MRQNRGLQAPLWAAVASGLAILGLAAGLLLAGRMFLSPSGSGGKGGPYEVRRENGVIVYDYTTYTRSLAADIEEALRASVIEGGLFRQADRDEARLYRPVSKGGGHVVWSVINLEYEYPYAAGPHGPGGESGDQPDDGEAAARDDRALDQLVSTVRAAADRLGGTADVTVTEGEAGGSRFPVFVEVKVASLAHLGRRFDLPVLRLKVTERNYLPGGIAPGRGENRPGSPGTTGSGGGGMAGKTDATDNSEISGSSGALGGTLESSSQAAGKPIVAIVIDDMGYGRAGTEEILGLDVPITVAIMPYGSHAAEESARAREKGHGVILHQPMEPISETTDPGPGTITVDMDDATIRQVLADNLSRVPGAIGVNNHMGSKATSDRRVMEAVMDEVASRGLFFLDSRTIASSVAAEVAAEKGLPPLSNQVFLDNQDDVEYIKERLRLLLQVAVENGAAIGIGHVRPNTAAAIEEMIPAFRAAGVEFVTLDRMAERVAGR